MQALQYKNHNIYLTQKAYIAEDGTHYQAHGTSIDGQGIEYEFLLTWDIKNTHDETDESTACDWEIYEVKELGEKLI